MFDARGDGRRERRAAVADEASLQRGRIGQLLAHDLRLDVVHASSGIRSLIEWLSHVDRTRWPHLLVVGVPAQADAVSYADAVSGLRGAGMRVLAISSSPARHVTRRLLSDGIEGVVSVSDSETEFLSTATRVLAGHRSVTPRAASETEQQARGPRLSLQEERVLALYASGYTIGEVAARIGVRDDTARKYLTRVRDKYTAAGWPARSKLQLARIAWEEGYADPDGGASVPALSSIPALSSVGGQITALDTTTTRAGRY